MHWIKIDKTSAIQPPTGEYRHWKNYLREEGKNQCIYCCIHESCFGGERNFVVEHYRPKSRFDHLKNNITNLFFACSICNCFKGSDWPNEPAIDHSNCAYPNPADVDYNNLIIVDEITERLEGRHVASRYVIERLYLNRGQLLMERKTARLNENLDKIIAESNEIITALKDKARDKYKIKLCDVMMNINKIIRQLYSAVPYNPADVKR